jgi:hypothetical protein
MRYDSPIGGDLTALQYQMKNVPNEVLQQYVAQKHPINSLPAGIELSRRAQMQQQAQASQAQAAQSQPTVVASAAQQLGIGSLAPQGQPQGQPQGFAEGGIIAFNGEGSSQVPNADISDDESLPLMERIRRNILRARQPTQKDDFSNLSLSERLNRPEGPRVDSDKPYPETSYTRSLASPTILPPVEKPAPAPSPARTSPPLAGPAPAAVKPETPAVAPSQIGPKQQGLYNILGEAENFFANPPAGMTEAELSRIREEEFKKRQGISAPYLKQMQDMLDKERAGARRSDVGNDALLRFGLGLIGKRRSDIGAAGISALDYFEKTKEKEAAAISENNRAQRLLLEARLRDERGDYEGADRSAKEARTAQQNANVLAGQAMGKRVDIAGKGAEAERKDEVAEAQRIHNDRMAGLREQVIELRARGLSQQAASVQQQIQNADLQHQLRLMTANANLRDKARDNVDKRIATDYRLQSELAKNPGLRDELIRKETLALGGTEAGGGAGQKEVSFADAIKSR